MSVAFMLTALICLVAVSAVFSSCETAFLSLSYVRMRQMLKQKIPKAKLIEKLKNDMPFLLTTILVGNNFVNSLASALAAAVALALAGKNGAYAAVPAAAACMTALIIVFGEVLPKTIASLQSEQIAVRFASFLYALEKILFVPVWLFSRFAVAVNALSDIFGKAEAKHISEDELKTLFDVGSQEGTLERSEKDMLHRIFEFGDLRVRDIVCPRTMVYTIDAEATYEQTVQAVARSGFSRLPVCASGFDNVIGLIHFKDLLFYAGSKADFSPKKIMHTVLFVPETKTALSLLHVFKTESRHFAIVVDEHGSNCGIVTMDDILKAVFGRITDEYNTHTQNAEQRITVVNPYEFVIPGDILLSEINNMFALELVSEEYETFAGWLLECFGYLPESGEHIVWKNIVFTVEEQRNRRIQRIRIQYAKEMPKER